MATHMYGLAVYVKVELPFSLESTLDSCLCFQQTLPYSVPYYLLYQSPSLYLCMVFDTIWSNTDGLLNQHIC